MRDIISEYLAVLPSLDTTLIPRTRKRRHVLEYVFPTNTFLLYPLVLDPERELLYI